MVDHQAAIWDIAPMPVIIGEAGGRMSDLAGTDSITSDSGLATNGRLHDDLLALLAPR
jgi:histidinol-phosphatase